MERKKEKTLNPLLAMTASGKRLADSMMEMTGKPVGQDGGDIDDPPIEAASSKSTFREWRRFIEGLDEFTGVKGQGSAVWIPTEVKKQIELIRANARTNIPIRALAAAMIVAFIEEHRKELGSL